MSKGPHAPGVSGHSDSCVPGLCGARTRSGKPCATPGMRNGRCRMHGGASTGPRTAEGLARCTAAATKHGRRNANARGHSALRGEARALSALLRELRFDIISFTPQARNSPPIIKKFVSHDTLPA